MDIFPELPEAPCIKKLFDPLPGVQPKVRPALRADFEILFELFVVNDLFAFIAFGPDAFRNSFF
jgi:hypothetical protein